MKVVRFTKFWADLSVEAMTARALELGYDGFDLAVREGHAITPANVAEELPKAVAAWSQEGLECPLITAEVGCTDATEARAQALFAAAGEAGVSNIKVGYFQYQPGDDFQATWDFAKRRLEEFAALADRTGVRAVYHTHSGLCLGSNCAGLRHLLEGFDPAFIGAYPDLGHLAVNGEDVRMGFAMLDEYLAAVSAKDARHVPDGRAQADPAFADGFVLLGQGAAQLSAAVDYLHHANFDGPISVHTEYTLDQAVIERVGGLDQSREAQVLRDRGEVEDLARLRVALAGVT